MPTHGLQSVFKSKMLYQRHPAPRQIRLLFMALLSSASNELYVDHPGENRPKQLLSSSFCIGMLIGKRNFSIYIKT
jgi:hypothetical protein